MATITTITTITTKGGDTRYKATIRRKGKVLTARQFSTKKAATAWSRRVESDTEYLDALSGPGKTKTFAEVAREYERDWRKRDKKDRSIPTKVKFWSDRLGDKKVLDIDLFDLNAALDEYAGGRAHRGNGPKKTAPTGRPRSPGTVNRMKATGSAIFKYAVGKEYVTRNPFSAVPSKEEPRGRRRYLTQDDLKTLLTACEASEWPKLKLLVTMAVTTGAHLDELLGLFWNDIDFRNKSATLHDTKNGESRLLPLSTPTIAELMKYREAGNHRVFPSVTHPHRAFEFRPFWGLALEEAGIENFRFHDLRHSAASFLIKNGCSIYDVKEILGHKSITTTQRYAHLDDEHKKTVAETAMSAVFSEGS